MTKRIFALVALCTRPAFAVYTYQYTDPLTTNQTQNWDNPEINGSQLSFTPSGLTSTATNGGSLIYNATMNGLPNNYEVNMTLTLTQGGGVFISYLRASANALSGPGLQGTFYSVEIQNPTFAGANCTATLVIVRTVNGQFTLPVQQPVPCNNGMTVRSVYTQTSGIDVYINNIWYAQYIDSSPIASGQPGIGVRGTWGSNYIGPVSFGPLDTTAPNAVSSQSIASSSFSTSSTLGEVDLEWQPPSDGANGTGVAQYILERNGTFLDFFQTAEFTDSTVVPGTSYTYSIIAIDFHFNYSLTATTITVVAAPAYAIDPRSVGLRSTGSSWGGAGEQINMRSGNLNFTIPLLKAQGRGGWSVGFNLTYNSQNWRLDMGGTWMLGKDEGYGFGWKLLAGSLIPYYSNHWVLSHYVFTDATGAEYRLDQNNSGVWSSLDAAYLWYDSTARTLHFPDGSFWTMACISAGTEDDAGTRYPTAMEDSNGNQIFIRYNAGRAPVGITQAPASNRSRMCARRPADLRRYTAPTTSPTIRHRI